MPPAQIPALSVVFCSLKQPDKWCRRKKEHVVLLLIFHSAKMKAQMKFGRSELEKSGAGRPVSGLNVIWKLVDVIFGSRHDGSKDGAGFLHGRFKGVKI